MRIKILRVRLARHFCLPLGHALQTRGSGGRFIIKSRGNIGIGVNNPSAKLEVNGTVRATTFSAQSPPWSDFVFNSDYRLRSLYEVEKYIKEHNHLPDIPSEKDVKKNGIDLLEVNAKLLQKIEELTLYTIDQEKRIEKQNMKIEDLEKQNKEILKLLKASR